MAELKGLVLSLSEIHTSPRAMLIALNRLIANHLDARSFITMTYAVVDLDARTMTHARAGHTPLIYVPGPGSEMTPGVHVLALCPGATKTEFQQVAGVSEKVPKFTYMSAQAVVRQAIAAARSGKRTLVPGWMNKVLIGSARLTPRRVLTQVAGSMFTPKDATSRGG